MLAVSSMTAPPVAPPGKNIGGRNDVITCDFC